MWLIAVVFYEADFLHSVCFFCILCDSYITVVFTSKFCSSLDQDMTPFEGQQFLYILAPY